MILKKCIGTDFHLQMANSVSFKLIYTALSHPYVPKTIMQRTVPNQICVTLLLLLRTVGFIGVHREDKGVREIRAQSISHVLPAANYAQRFRPSETFPLPTLTLTHGNTYFTPYNNINKPRPISQT